ncbi:hypothetical protein OKA05_12370 [Luteolibacter arcticus]|uniref:Uncharacterized protein n=1 Tax=Luteolibacter arcticus TaxID=1581411 RepID=A0ABT3GIN7_9BACT|nr:hypothetical protein [Luteolibacter arcticus]MCW1923351.1 hypothetical protein [Luteolibacter arcticus]
MPGTLLWVGGMIYLFLSCWIAFESPASHRLGPLISMGVSFIAILFGFAMAACSGILNGAKRYRMPGARLPAYLGLELLEALLAISCVCVALTAIAMFAKGEPLTGILWTCGEAIVAFLLVRTWRNLRSKGQIWRAELIDQPPPFDPGQ